MKRYNPIIAAAGAMALAFPPLAKADDGPLALVEHVEGADDTGLSPFDYVYEGDRFDLRDDGVLTLAFFATCEVTTFTGGVIKLKSDEVKVSKGGLADTTFRPCQTAALAVSDEAREAGAAAYRVSPFSGEEWREVSVPTEHPQFIWPDAGEGNEYEVSVYYLDAETPWRVWSAPFAGGRIVYPLDAPALEPGMPYEVVIERKGKRATSAVFSIDPGLELPESILTSAIPLGL